ncbi:MAG: PEP-CTERM sorting domain-containing protein [Verrucomicrobiales bacterium]
MKTIILLTSLIAVATTAEAQVLTDGRMIGLNFSGGAGSEAPDPDVDTVDAGEVTGVVPQANWNNAQGASGALTGLVDSTGAATGVDVFFASNNTWGRNLTPSPTNDLLSDYLDAGTGTPANVQFQNVPFSLYDVYIYTRRNENADPNDPTPADGPGRFSDYTVNGVNVDVLTGDVQNSFVLATSTVIGNYVKFDNVTGATLDIFANLDAANSFRAPVDGVQIVEQIPEPASLGLLGATLLSLLALRRQRSV